MPITPSYMVDLETRIESIQMNEYSRLGSMLWWQRIAKLRPSLSRVEIINWLWETAQIERPNASHGGGQAIFSDIVGSYMSYENENAVAGLELKKEQMEDVENGIVGGEGMRYAAHWARQTGAHSAYWPQQVIAQAMNLNPVTYDGLSFFNGAHPYNPFDSGAGTYANLHKTSGGASGLGALPIDVSVAPDVALSNLMKAVAYSGANYKMPNGVLPRFLRVAGILAPSALMPRVVQLTDAKFLAQAASSGGGSGDVQAIIRYMGLGTPVECPELGAAFGGSDTTYYLAMESVTTDQLGAFIYIQREPFSTLMHGPMTTAELARIRRFQWTLEGRNTVAPGHPFLLVKCQAT